MKDDILYPLPLGALIAVLIISLVGDSPLGWPLIWLGVSLLAWGIYRLFRYVKLKK
jgi:hypothetical protein